MFPFNASKLSGPGITTLMILYDSHIKIIQMLQFAETALKNSTLFTK